MLSPVFLRRAWVAIGWLGVVLLFYLCLTPQPPEIPMEQGDKLGHALAYVVLTYWWVTLFPETGRRVLIAAILLAVGIGIEFLQRWTGYRTFDYYDMLADAVGIAIGWLAACPRTPDVLQWLSGGRFRSAV
jgi:VanZ family protein